MVWFLSKSKTRSCYKAVNILGLGKRERITINIYKLNNGRVSCIGVAYE